MTAPKAEDVKRGIAVIWENLQCPICLDLMNAPISTKCDHQFCKFCMMKLLEKNKRKETSCPVCKTKVTKRSLQESPGFQRLVEGLQHLVQSYEFDTCTNYVTGIPQKRKETSLDTESDDQTCSGENTFSGDVMEKSASCSSSAAAKDAFARLMNLADSGTVTEQDGFDSGLGELPLESEKQPAELEDDHMNMKTEVEQSNSLTPNDDPNEETDTPKKRPSRRAKRVGLDPERIVAKKQKKSVEKVAEWLLKISPSDVQTKHSSGVSRVSDDGDSEKDSVCLSSPTEVLVKVDDKAEISPPREVPGRGLEEQVFGAVYKRERRGSKRQVKRSFCSEKEIVTDPNPPNSMEEEDEIKRNVPKGKRKRTLTHTDLVQKSFSGVGCDQQEPKESNIEIKQDNVTKSNGDMPLNCSEEHNKVVENCQNDGKISIEESPVFEVPLKRPGRRSKSKMQDVWQDVDLDLKEKQTICDNKSQKRLTRRNNSESTKDFENAKNTRCSKSLTLVKAAGNEALDLTSKPKLVEAEVNIESYPSSAEPRSPDARATRRSLRLQEFTAEVQGSRKRTKLKRASRKPADESEKNPTNDPSQSNFSSQPKADDRNLNKVKTDASEGKTDASQGNTGHSQNEKTAMKNGCIYNSELEQIETMQMSEDAAVVLPEESFPEENSLSVVPDTVEIDKQNIPHSSEVVGSPTPLVADTPDSSLPEKRQESPSTGVVAPSVVEQVTESALMPSEGRLMEEEADLMDSEADTEQLMKTFKVTKRKSFSLGSPKSSKAKIQSLGKPVKEQKKLQVEIAVIVSEDGDHDLGLRDISQGEELQPCELVSCEKPSQKCLSSFTDESVSLLQKLPSALAIVSQDENSTNSQSSGLSPNRVARSSQNSKLYPETAASSQLFFASITDEEPQICNGKRPKNDLSPTSVTRSKPRTPDTPKDTNQAEMSLDLRKSPDIQLGSRPNSGIQINHLESSITPDGLLAEEAGPHEPGASQSSPEMEKKASEILSQPCVLRKRKRKAQRLESSESELSAEDDDLPSMTQIFKSHPSHSPSGQKLLQKADSSNQDGRQIQEPNPGLEASSQQSPPLSEAVPEAQSSQLSQCVSPSQNREPLENVKTPAGGAAVQDARLPQSPCRDEWITSSQGSVDLFGTPEESEAVDGAPALSKAVDGNSAPSRESSQYSSELLNTQQKEEMQQELCRLERMMALVSEALQKKETDSGARAHTEGPDPTHSLHHSDLGEAGSCQAEKLTSRAPDPLEAPRLCPPLTRSQARTAGQKKRRAGQKTGIRGRRCSQRSQAGLQVRGEDMSVEASSAEPAEEEEEPQRGSSVTDMCRLGVSRTAEEEEEPQRGSSVTDMCRLGVSRMELVASGLSAPELAMVKRFAKKMQGSLSKEMTPNTTHVIIKTDADLVCERTLKYFQGIAGRKWVVSFLWISECFSQGKILSEAQFEVCGDVVNGHDHNGPLRSRTSPDDQLLMKGYEICFQGSFTGMSTDQMGSMVEMCGATVMKDPLMFTKQAVCQLVVVQPGADDSQSYYKALQKKATVVTRGWLLDTIATYTLQNPANYKP